MRQDRYRHRVSYLLLAAMLALAGAQGATAAAEVRTIQLQDGSIYRGELVEWIPGSHVTLRLATGEIRRVSWTDLALQPPAPTVPPPDALPPGALPPPGAAAGEPAGGTLVTIRSKNPNVQLTQNTGQSYTVGYGYGGTYAGSIDAWRAVCRTPCNQVVPAGGPYRITGPGIVPSSAFELPLGNAEIEVRAGTVHSRVSGLFMTVFGSSFAITGGVLLGLGNSFNHSPLSSSSEVRAFRIAGGVILGVGVGLLANGIGRLVRSRTRVQIITNPGGDPIPVSLRLPSGRTLGLSAQGLHF